jgi:Tfp pilus assembly protein PilX
MNCSPRARQKGYLLISALLALMVMSGLAIGLVYLVNTETNIGYSDEAGTLAYYGAEAALEKLSADLGKLYSAKQSPTAADIAALTASMPDLGNSLKVIDYKIHFADANGKTTDASGNPLTAPTVTAGTIGGNSPYAGLTAQIIKMLLRVTVITSTGQQVQVSREVEVALIPVFQFGAFSDEDLAYHAGADFDFGGRVHTNGSLFLASSSSAGTTLHAQVTAVKEVIRAELQNGVSTSSANKTSAIWIPTAANGCEGSKPACRELKLNEGSTIGGPYDDPNPGWSGVVNQYNTFLQNRVTALSLPFVGGGVPSFELLRRPNGESADSPLANSRMYYLAQIRVLVDDSSSALKNVFLPAMQPSRRLR